MSDEAAFLDALAANPADDTARLVYADWLDEHGKPAKAEYLRLVVALARAETDYARDQSDVARTLALAEALPAEWRAFAGSRFKLVFHDCPDRGRIVSVIKAMRTTTGVGLAQAKEMAWVTPNELLACVPFENAFSASETVGDAGGTTQILLTERNQLPDATRYDLIGSGAWQLSPRRSPYSTEERARLSASLQSLLKISAEVASTLLAGGSAVLAGQLDLSDACNQRRELDDLVRWFFASAAVPGPLVGIGLSLVPTPDLLGVG